MSDRTGVKGLLAKMRKISNPEKALKQIGISLVSSTKNRFNQGVDPQGNTWEPRSEATISILESKNRLTNKTLVVTSELQRSIGFIATKNSVKVGSNKEYAKINNQGGTSTFNGRQVEIPQRQFLGISKNDERQIKMILDQHMRGNL